MVGNGKRADLDASGCKGHCAQGDVDVVKRLYISADVSLGVGLASLVVSGILFLTRRAGAAPPAVAIEPLRRGALVLVPVATF